MDRGMIDVLLVEDNPLHRHLLKGVLEEISEGCKVRIETTLAAGIAASREGKYDVVLLDLVLPDCRGFETFLRWKAEGASIPVVVLTGLDDMEIATRAVENGAQDYLLKNQINPALLARSVRYAVERGQVKNREWDSPDFRRAHHQLMKAADKLELGEELRKALLFPHRATFSTIPLWREGEYLNVSAYRVQHLPGKSWGASRVGPAESLGKVTSRAMAMSWKCALFCPEYSGAAGAIWAEGRGFQDEEIQEAQQKHLAGLAEGDQVYPAMGSEKERRQMEKANEAGMKFLLAEAQRRGKGGSGDDVFVIREREKALTAEAAANLEADVVVEAVEGGIFPEADEVLREKRILVIPDLFTRAGGVIEGCFSGKANEEVIRRELKKVFARAWERGERLEVDLRTAAMVEAIEVIEARHFREAVSRGGR